VDIKAVTPTRPPVTIYKIDAVRDAVHLEPIAPAPEVSFGYAAIMPFREMDRNPVGMCGHIIDTYA